MINTSGAPQFIDSRAENSFQSKRHNSSRIFPQLLWLLSVHHRSGLTTSLLLNSLPGLLQLASSFVTSLSGYGPSFSFPISSLSFPNYMTIFLSMSHALSLLLSSFSVLVFDVRFSLSLSSISLATSLFHFFLDFIKYFSSQLLFFSLSFFFFLYETLTNFKWIRKVCLLSKIIFQYSLFFSPPVITLSEKKTSTRFVTFLRNESLKYLSCQVKMWRYVVTT